MFTDSKKEFFPAPLAVFNNYGVRSFWVMSSNGHAWLNWRRYLYQTAQIMFPEDH